MGQENIQVLTTEIDEAYSAELHRIIRQPSEIEKAQDLKIVYTAIHGSGITLVPQALGKSRLQSRSYCG